MSIWHIERFAQIESTNAHAMARIQQAMHQGPLAVDSLHGLVIHADRQSAGRGQHGRLWSSPPGGLYMSAVIANLPLTLRPLTALLAGVAVAEALESAGINSIALRWPNDLVITSPIRLAASRTPSSQNTSTGNAKKVAGILCEGLAIDQHWLCIIGIGINVNTNPSELPPELSTRATTLLAHDGNRRDISQLLHSILARLVFWIQANPENIIQAIQSRDALRGKHVTLHAGEISLSGLATGIDSNGALTLTTESNSHHIPLGSIQTVDGIPIR